MAIYTSTADVAAAIDCPIALDSRDHEAFVGNKQTPYVAESGTIPTSVNVDADPDSLRLIFVAAGADVESPAITFCDSGHLSALTRFDASGISTKWNRDRSPLGRLKNRLQNRCL